MYLITFDHWLPAPYTYTHEGLEQAGHCEEPQDAERLRHGAPWLKPQQQIGQDSEWRGEKQPVRWALKARMSSAPEDESELNSEGSENTWVQPNQPWDEFADGCAFAAAHQISNQRVRHRVPGPTHK